MQPLFLEECLKLLLNLHQRKTKGLRSCSCSFLLQTKGLAFNKLAGSDVSPLDG